MFSKATALVHHWINAHVQLGDVVVDATCGNGHDTLVLAQRVGKEGRVVAVDIQTQAIERSKQLVARNGVEKQVALHCMSHDRLIEVLPQGETIRCAVFNLGYLPGGDKSVVTKPSTSLNAHKSVLECLKPGGIVITTIYTGHPGGSAEADALVGWSQELDGKRFSVARHEWINQDGEPPFILIIQRRPRREKGAGSSVKD